MDRLGIKEGEVIQHPMITKSIERAQKKVEENNFGIRKRLLEYDDVMNSQREVIYKKRRHALYGDRLAIDIANMMYDVCEQIIIEHQDNRDFEGFSLDVIRNFGIESPFREKEFLSENSTELTEKLFDIAYSNYKTKRESIAEKVYPVVKEVYETQSRYENIAIPITDGRKMMQVIANLKKANETKGREVALAIDKGVTLATIDDAWKDHLREMDDLRQSVQAASYEQKDPLLIYKFESFELFKKMIERINKESISFIIKGNLPVQDSGNVREAHVRGRPDMSKLKEERTDLLSQAHSNTQQPQKSGPIKVEKKIGRNDPCPCGSGKKYKYCHGAGK
jgi:preprotein translocase subunit SecA